MTVFESCGIITGVPAAESEESELLLRNNGAAMSSEILLLVAAAGRRSSDSYFDKKPDKKLLLLLEQRYIASERKQIDDEHVRELSMRSLKRLIYQLKEEITRFESHIVVGVRND